MKCIVVILIALVLVNADTYGGGKAPSVKAPSGDKYGGGKAPSVKAPSGDKYGGGKAPSVKAPSGDKYGGGKAPSKAKSVKAPSVGACVNEGVRSCETICKAHCDNGVGNGPDCRPGRARYANDDPAGTGPGNPGARQKIEYDTNQKGDNRVGGVDQS